MDNIEAGKSGLPLTRYPGDWPEINEGRAKEAKEASELILNWASSRLSQSRGA